MYVPDPGLDIENVISTKSIYRYPLFTVQFSLPILDLSKTDFAKKFQMSGS